MIINRTIPPIKVAFGSSFVSPIIGKVINPVMLNGFITRKAISINSNEPITKEFVLISPLVIMVK